MKIIVLSFVAVASLAIASSGCSSSSAQDNLDPFPDDVVSIPGLEILQIVRLPNGAYLMTAFELGFATELYVSDGTPEGTELVVSRDPGNLLDVNHLFPDSFNGGYYFQGGTPETGRELWFTDGSAQGTVLIRDSTPGPGHSTVRDFLVEPNLLTVLVSLDSPTLETEIITITGFANPF